MDILAGAKHSDGKTKVIRGGILTLRSIRAMMTAGEGDAGPGDDGAEARSPKLLVAFQRRNFFIFF